MWAPALAIGGAVRYRNVLAVEYRELEHVAIRNDAGQHPVARAGHLHLSLDQRLGDIQVGEKLAGPKDLVWMAPLEAFSSFCR